MLYRAGDVIATLIEKNGAKSTTQAQEKIKLMLRPASAQSEENSVSQREEHSEEVELAKKFFGISTNEAKAPGMFCSCLEEINARVNVQKLHDKPVSVASDGRHDRVFDVGCEVLAYTLAGIPEREQKEVVDKLFRAMQIAIPGAVADTSPKEFLSMCLARGLKRGGKGGRDHPEAIRVKFW